MNKIKLFKNLVLLLTFFLSASSCKNLINQNQEPRIRITDLSGNPKNVEVTTPQGNAEILANLEQNPNYQIPQETKKTPIIIETGKQNFDDQPVNKYARMEDGKEPTKTNTAPAVNRSQNNSSAKLPIVENQSREAQLLEEQAQITKQEIAKTEEQKQTTQIAEKTKTDSEAKTAQNTTAANTANKPTSDKIFVFKPMKNEDLAAANTTKTSTKSGEIYVQLGLFSQMGNAKKALDSAQNIASGEVKEENIGGKNSYRALLGPFPSNTQAQEIIRQLSKSGKDSFVYKK